MRTIHVFFSVGFAALVGFHLRSIIAVQELIDYETMSKDSFLGKEQSKSPKEQPKSNPPPAVKDPAYWFDLTTDDFYERVYVDTAPLTHLREVQVKHYFPIQCGLYRFNNSALPTVSVIMTMRNEQPGMVSLTTHAILARTPPELLVEVIIINDSDLKDTAEMRALERVSEKVVHIHTKEREGCARSRLIGARVAKGEVLMFIDSHVEMLSSTWYQHLVLPILENPRTVTSQQLQYMGDLANHTYNDLASRGSHYGAVTEKFFFGYESYRFKGQIHQMTPSPWEPYEMPFAPGALFAVRKDEFWRLGGYDEGLYVWGAENLEFSIKIWLCGGRLVQVPCSSTGHMYRVKDAHKWTNDNFTSLETKLGLNFPGGEFKAYGGKQPAAMTKIWLRNNIRITNLWLGDTWKRFYYKVVFGSEYLAPEWAQFEKEDDYMRKQIRFREKNQCRDFTWFDTHVYMRLLGIHTPWWGAYQAHKKAAEEHRALNNAYQAHKKAVEGRNNTNGTLA